MKIFVRQLAALVRLSFLELLRRHELVVMGFLLLALIVPLSLSSPFGVAGASRYLDEVALLLVWAFSLFIALGTGSRLFPPEFDARTIYPLLAKPISRGRLLVGKFCGATAATWAALVFFYAVVVAFSLLKGGAVSVEWLQGIALHFVFAAFAVAFVLLASLIFSRGAALSFSGIILVAMFFFGRRLPVYADSVGEPLSWLVEVFYSIGPHVEFFDMRQRMIHGWGAVDGAVFAAVIAYGTIYTALLLYLAAAVLRRKRL